MSVSTNIPEEPSCWFISIACLDDIAERFTVTPDRSAFDPYQRPVHVMSLFDASLEEDDDADEDYENCDDRGIKINDDTDDIESSTWSPIERTYSFDDWNMDAEIPVVPPSTFPVAFRFETSSTQQHARRSSEGIATISRTAAAVPFDDLLSGRSNNRFIEQSCSMRPIVPSSDTYFFNPIRGDQCSFNSDGTSAVLTMSIISVETEFTRDYVMSPECRGIPRLASYDENYHSPDQAFAQIDTDLPFSMKKESLRSPHKVTSTSAPIPEFVFVRKEAPKCVRPTLLKSWKKVFRIGRKKNDWSAPSKRSIICNQRRVSTGEF